MSTYRKLEETRREILQTRAEVVESLRVFYAEPSELPIDGAIDTAAQWTSGPIAEFTAENDLQALQRLNDDLLDTVDQLQLDVDASPVTSATHAPQATLIASLAQRERLHTQIQQSRAIIALAEQLTDIDRRLAAVDVAIDRRQFTAAAEAISTIDALIFAVADGTGDVRASEDESEIIRSIRVQLLAKKSRLVDQLKQFYRHAVQWSEGLLKVSAPLVQQGTLESSSSLSEQLRDFWKACDLLDLLMPRLKDLAKAITQQLVKPLLRLSNASVEEQVSADAFALRIGGDPRQTAAVDRSLDIVVAEVQVKCASVVAILLFVHNELFGGSAELMNRLGDVLWKIPGNLEAILMGLLRDKIPQEAQALNLYRDALVSTVSDMLLFRLMEYCDGH